VSAFASVAWAGNQEVAEQIAQSFRQSGQMHDYKIGVKYQQGTVWLVGRVTSEQQLSTALKLVMQSPHVERVVNNLSIAKPESDQPKGAPVANSPASNGPADGPKLLIGAVRELDHEPATATRGTTRTSGFSGGLTTAERLQRAVDNHARDARSKPVGDSAASNEMNQADRVPASFEPVPAQPTSVTQLTGAHPTPTLAQPLPAQRAPMPDGQARVARRPVPVAYTQPNAAVMGAPGMAPAGPQPMYTAAAGGGVAPARYDQPRMPNYAWPSYAAYPNYAAVTYPKQYSPTAWPYIGPFYPYPQVPLGWRKVTLEWDNGWWMLDFKDR
jgi:hypothetical protein